MAVYEDFEPFCKWQREQGHDTLEVHLQGFRKDQLKIQLSNVGVMIISGQRPLDENKNVWSRFRKELKLEKIYKNNEINAKLSRGVLYIVMPKISLPSTPDFQEQRTILPPDNQEKERNETLLATANKDQSDSEKNVMNKSYGRFRLRDLVNNRKIAGNVAVGIALAILMAIMYKYRQPSYVDN